DMVAHGLKELPNVHLDRLPRMADFARWSTACETAIWPAGTFWAAYCGNRDEAVDSVIEADPIAAAGRASMATQTQCTGTASDLLGALGKLVDERLTKAKTWPDTPRALSGRLRRASTFLRKIGIEISFKKVGRAHTRIIELTVVPLISAPEMSGTQPSASSASSPLLPKFNAANGFETPDLQTVAGDTDGGGKNAVPTVRTNPPKFNGETAADGADANIPRHCRRATGWSKRL